jgi:hypothetical protein
LALAITPEPTFLTKLGAVGFVGLAFAAGYGIADAAKRLDKYNCG